jgi:hypothetical protein
MFFSDDSKVNDIDQPSITFTVKASLSSFVYAGLLGTLRTNPPAGAITIYLADFRNRGQITKKRFDVARKIIHEDGEVIQDFRAIQGEGK